MTTNLAAAITITTCISAVIISGLLMIGTATGGNLKSKIYRLFFFALIITAIGSLFEGAVTWIIVWPKAPFAMLLQVADFGSYVFGSILAIFFTLYVYEYLSIKTTVRKSPFTFMILCICINIVLIVVGFTIGHYSLVDGNNNYTPQILETIANIPTTMALLMLIVVTLCNIKHLKPREWVPLLMYSVIPILCYGIENIFVEYPLWITYYGSSIVLLLAYINLQVELKYTLLEREKELTESRIDIMMTQIQPHFIHNSLIAIQYLCNKDAKEAEKAVIEFSEYLRGNLGSLTNKKPIKFKQELEHLYLYLKLEQRRFEERLQVEYDIGVSDFKLPALTLQPIVENAVLHGITKKVEGGKITIRTREDGSHQRIIVEDTGIGFDTSQPISNDRPHLGIQNVRYRLQTMCKGTLEIKSTPGIGTTATISIPIYRKEVRTSAKRLTLLEGKCTEKGENEL